MERGTDEAILAWEREYFFFHGSIKFFPRTHRERHPDLVAAILDQPIVTMCCGDFVSEFDTALKADASRQPQLILGVLDRWPAIQHSAPRHTLPLIVAAIVAHYHVAVIE